MPAIPDGPLDRPQAARLASALRERVVRPVSIEVWTREAPAVDTGERDPGRHSRTTLNLLRQMKALNSSISLTPYDLDRHATMAADRSITESPTVVVRCAGRSITTLGLFLGPLFPVFLDQIGFLSLGRTPLAPETRGFLRGLSADVTIEAFLTPYDGASAKMIPLLGSMAVEGKRVRVTEIEATQFPLLAGRRLVTEVPLLVINGHRFAGFFNEDQLVEQLRQVVEGSDAPVRDQVRAAPYLSEDEIRERSRALRAATATTADQPGGPETAADGLIIPGS